MKKPLPTGRGAKLTLMKNDSDFKDKPYIKVDIKTRLETALFKLLPMNEFYSKTFFTPEFIQNWV